MLCALVHLSSIRGADELELVPGLVEFASCRGQTRSLLDNRKSHAPRANGADLDL